MATDALVTSHHSERVIRLLHFGILFQIQLIIALQQQLDRHKRMN